LGHKKGEADRHTQERFGYSEPKKVRDIRKKEGEIKSRGWLVHRCERPSPDAIALWIEKPTIYLSDEGHFELLGIGWYWQESMDIEASYGVLRANADMKNIDFETSRKLIELEGPLIFIAF
jgi:hypothetical protein